MPEELKEQQNDLGISLEEMVDDDNFDTEIEKILSALSI